MKKLVTLLFIVFASNLLFSQTGNYDTRLLSKFSDKELQELKKNNADSYNYWNFMVANAYSVMDLPSGKSNDKEIKGSVKITDMAKVNILELRLMPISNQYQYYKIEGTTKMLMILPEEQVKSKYNASTNTK